MVGKDLGVADSWLPDGKLLCIFPGLGYQLHGEPGPSGSHCSQVGRAPLAPLRGSSFSKPLRSVTAAVRWVGQQKGHVREILSDELTTGNVSLLPWDLRDPDAANTGRK